LGWGKSISFVRPHSNTMNPDDARKRHRAIQSVDSRWYLDFKTQEICHKPMTLFQQLKHLRLRPVKNTVWELYVWSLHRQAKEDAILFPIQIIADQVPIKGLPRKYALTGGWTIPESDLKHLRDGPLASEDLRDVLVPAARGWRPIFDFIFRIFDFISRLLLR
jgi:hypothetical protein